MKWKEPRIYEQKAWVSASMLLVTVTLDNLLCPTKPPFPYQWNELHNSDLKICQSKSCINHGLVRKTGTTQAILRGRIKYKKLVKWISKNQNTKRGHGADREKLQETVSIPMAEGTKGRGWVLRSWKPGEGTLWSWDSDFWGEGTAQLVLGLLGGEHKQTNKNNWRL